MDHQSPSTDLATRDSSAEDAAPADERLQIGIGVLDQPPEGASREAPAEALVKQALVRVDVDRLPVRCILLLATADWCKETSGALPRAIRREFKKALGYDVPLIGGSLAAMFYLDEEDRYVEHGIILGAVCSFDFWASVISLEAPHGTNEEERRQRLTLLAKELEGRAATRLGASAARHLLAFSPGIFLNARGEPVYMDNELHEEILAAFGYRYGLIGGAAADGLEPTAGYQFADDKCLKSGLALAMVETDLASGTMMGHGFTADRSSCVAVDGLKDDAESGYEVAVMDGKPAAERLAELRETTSPGMPRVLLGAPAGLDYHVVCALHEAPGPGGYVRLSRKVRRGDRLFVLRATREQMSEVGRAVINGAVQASGASKSSMKALFGLSCTGRIEVHEELGHDWKATAARLKAEFPGVPLVGGLGAGEFGVGHWRRAMADNFTFWVNCLGSSRTPRAATRVLQDKLLAAANSLSERETPKSVMQGALKAAAEAGAVGGQVCIVDDRVGRILGLQVGCSFSPPGSPHDWARVAARTDRPISGEPGGEFPRYLLDWSLPVGAENEDGSLEIVGDIPPEEDILTLVVRARRAVFVADSAESIFHCEPETAKAGNVVTFLAIPLLGFGGKAIATLQLGFPNGFLIDHETFGVWLAYAQKLAAALERAQEAEERTIFQRISGLGNEIMQSPLDLSTSPHHWCDQYLQTVVKLLGPDGAHIRLFQAGPNGETYNLASAVGFLADLRKRARPVTHAGEGSCDLELLSRGGRVTNRRAETRDLNKDVKAKEGPHEDRTRFEAELESLESTAMLPLVHEGKVLGSFVIDSKERYFFTERRERLARGAAELGGAILRSRLDAYDRLALEKEQKWLLRNLAEAKEEATSFGLQGLLSRLCAAVRADVGSLFLRFEEAQKLILHTSHGWAENMEGKACYERGEGWTGGLALGNTALSIVGGDDPAGRAHKRKYYDLAIAPEHRVSVGEPDPRIGVQLKVGEKVVGVVTLAYFRQNRNEIRDPERLRRVKSFLAAVTDLITLAVEDARTEAARQQAQRLLETKNRVVERLMQRSKGNLMLKSVLDEVREGFDVARVVFHTVQDGRIAGSVASLSQGSPALRGTAGKAASAGIVLDLLGQETETIVRASDPEVLGRWPNPEGLRSLFAVLVSDTKGQVKGVLEIANRRMTRDHPFEFLEESERSAARDVARALGAAIAAAEDDRRRAAFERVEAKLRLSQEKAEAEKAMRDAFEDVAHQIKNPLGEAARRVEQGIARHSQGGVREEFEGLAALLRRAELTAKMIGLFATLAKGGQLMIQGRPLAQVDLIRMANEVCENQRPRISSRRNIRINCDADSFRHAPADMSADADLLLQALNNLVDNAVKYSYPDTTINVSCGPRRQGGFFIAVANVGLPILPREIPLVCRRHWRGEEAKTSVGEGNGLGLWIAEHIMRAHGGELLVLPTRERDGVTEVRLALPTIT
jgi:signal transduction histidine kinase